jgi:signal transduction histidine kinase
MAGLTWFDPAAIGTDTRPAGAVLSKLTILGDGGERALEPAAAPVLELGPHDRALTIEIAVPFFTRPDRCRVAHRLVGFEADWVDIGTRRSVRYTHLPAGRHLLEVRAANPDGQWGPVTVRLPLQVRPPVWQTWWFRLAAVAVAIAVLILAYRLRVARLLALERVRLRIAGDLHDELGSDLSGIAIAAGMVARRPDLEDRDRHRLEEAGATAVRVMQSLRDVVWCVDPDHDSAEALVDRLRTTATTLLEGHRVELELAAHGELSMDVRRILLQSAKELMHNVVRHARASSVRLALHDTSDGIELEVADDGAGFDPDAAASGTGLRRIARRVEAIGGTLSVATEPGHGTRITIQAPRLSTSRSDG